jgi:hypothetical protein
MEPMEKISSLLRDLYPQEASREEVLSQLKGEAGEIEGGPLRTYEPAQMEAVNETEKSIVYTITSSSIDRYKEIVDPHGLDLTNFRRSKRTVFWNHDTDRPIGRSMWEKKKGETWIAKVEFADGVTDFATDIWKLAKSGFIGMTSIGFQPKSFEWRALKDVKDLNPPNVKDFDKEMNLLIWRKSELLEYSVVGIGANPDAVQLEKAMSLVSGEMRHKLAEAVQEYRLCSLEDCKKDMETKMGEALEALKMGAVDQKLIADLLKRLEQVENIVTKPEPIPVEKAANYSVSQADVERILRGAISRAKGKVS